jgi:hypothetical protein
MPFLARPRDQAIDPVLADKYPVRIGHRLSQRVGARGGIACPGLGEEPLAAKL